MNLPPMHDRESMDHMFDDEDDDDDFPWPWVTNTAPVGVPVENNGAIFTPPELLIQSVVTLGEKATDGQLIEAVTIPWFEIVKWVEKDPRAIYQFDWRRWEEIIAGAYKAQGYTVILTPRSNDGGRDVIATRDDLGSIRIIEQVKAYAPKNLVTANDVMALIGVMHSEPNVSKAILTTTSDFAPGVYNDPRIQQYTPTRLQLRSGNQLREWLGAAARTRSR